MQLDPNCYNDDRPPPYACSSRACSATCPAAEGRTKTLTCFLHEVLIHGHDALHGGGSISVERGRADQTTILPEGQPADQQISSTASESCVSGQHYSQLITQQHPLFR